jgi:VWFA-related protein
MSLISSAPALADHVIFHGKVVMADGSPIAKPVGIEYYCPGKRIQVVALTGKRGDYFWNYAGTQFGNSVNATDASTIFAMSGPSAGAQMLALESGMDMGRVASASGYEALAYADAQSFGSMGCILRARATGMVSSMVDLSDRRLTRETQLPDIFLTRSSANEGLELDMSTKVPRAAQKEWSDGLKALQATKWDEAEGHLRAAVEAAPKFTLGWSALALARHNLHQAPEARDALLRAVELDPKSLSLRFRLMRTQMDAKDWQGAEQTATALTQADGGKRYPDAYLDEAVIQFHLKDLDRALASALEQVHRDSKREVPRGEYILGLIYEARREYGPAAEHMKKYLEIAPKALDAEAVRSRIDSLGKPTATDVASALDAADVQLAPEGQAWVPGGIQALATLAGFKDTADYTNFFRDFCQSIAAQAFPEDGKQIPGYYPRLQFFMSAVVELAALGEQQGDTAVVTLSLADGAARQRTEKALTVMGWKVAPHDKVVEPGSLEVDGLRQAIPAALGIDEIAMKHELEAGRSYRFEVRSENARLLGGAAWGVLLQGQPAVPGNLAGAFARDWRYAGAYAGLSSMDSGAATAVVLGVGLRAAVTRYADLLWRYADAFAVSKGAAAVPGGEQAIPVWEKVAGASPKSPAAFFRGLLEKDNGNLVAFYNELSRADAAHQRFFTANLQRVARFYAWYRDSGEVHRGQPRKSGAWRGNFLRGLPLDEAGHVRFPGGRRAWTASSGSDDDVLLGLASLEALVPVAAVEQRRGVALDEGSASLLAHHYVEWRHLLPYFEQLPGLGKADFEALAAFAAGAAKARPPRRGQMVGAWHSLVELIVLAERAGTMDAAAAARWFRAACEAAAANDFAARSLDVLREMAGAGPTVEDAVAGMLRLDGAHRAAFDRVRALQPAPAIATLLKSPDAAGTVTALSGLVYAALLGPDIMAISEDPLLVSKHQFVRAADNAPLFAASDLTLNSAAPGSYFVGGFMQFRERAQLLARAGEMSDTAQRGPARAPAVGGAQPPAENAGVAQPQTVFRTDARLVEVYATVTDGHGRPVDDIAPEEFAIVENGREVRPEAFENRALPVSCVLLLDTTGSMQAALPALKASAIRLIGELRPIDSMAVYGLADGVTVLQPFTTDKDAAGRAVLRTQAFGKTALYDALVRVSRDLAARAGKKVIVVFTDGADNQSALSGEIAIHRAVALGVPVYTIAQGDALESPELLKQLAGVSRATGGEAFTIRTAGEMSAVFESVSRDLTHGYLFAFPPAVTGERGWRAIEVKLRAPHGRKVRAREGYYAE